MKKLWSKILALSLIKWVIILATFLFMVFLFVMVYIEAGVWTMIFLIIISGNQIRMINKTDKFQKAVDSIYKYAEELKKVIDNITK